MFRAGIVGCGRIASEFDSDPKRKGISTHAGAYAASQKIELVALSDMDNTKLEKAGTRWGSTALYVDYKEMLRQESLDILSICTWNSTHVQIVEAAVNSGVKAIFCEKPIADTLENADAMIKLCANKGVLLQIDHQRRFDDFHQQLRAYLQSGKLGRVQQVSFYYSGGIANTGSHMFDLLRFFFGDVDWVCAVYSQNKSGNPNDPNIDGIIKFKSGLFGTIQACDVDEFLIFEMDCIGTKGRLRTTHSGRGLEFYEVRESHLFSGYKEIYSSTAPLDASVPRNPMVNAVEHLVACLEGQRTSICSGEDGRASLQLVCAFHESAMANGKRISLPLLDSDIAIKSR